MRTLTSLEGGMGLVKCEKGALDWSNAAQNFLLPNEDEALEDNGSRFFIGQFIGLFGFYPQKTNGEDSRF